MKSGELGDLVQPLMIIAEPPPALSAEPSAGGESYGAVHIVGWWQDVMGRILRLKVPRALCGELLDDDRDSSGPTAASPRCRHCAELNGNCADLKRVGSYSILFERSRGQKR